MMHCKSVVVAQELQTLLWAGINISTPPQNGEFSHYLGLFFFECSAFASLDGSHLEKCPGCILGICSVAFPGCDYWALQLQNKAGGSQPSVPVHTEVFLGWRSWLCSLYHWYLHWVVWKVWVQLLPGRSGAECVSFIPVNDLTSTQDEVIAPSSPWICVWCDLWQLVARLLSFGTVKATYIFLQWM